MRETTFLTTNEVAILADTSTSVVEKAVEQKALASPGSAHLKRRLLPLHAVALAAAAKSLGRRLTVNDKQLVARELALHDPRNWRELRLRPDEGGVLPDLRQQAANRQLSGSCPNAFSEQRHGSRSAHQSRRQQPSPQNARPTRLALASVPTREQPRGVVPGPCWLASGSNTPHRDRRLGAQALDRNLALRHAGPRTGRGDHRRIEFRRRSISGGSSEVATVFVIGSI